VARSTGGPATGKIPSNPKGGDEHMNRQQLQLHLLGLQLDDADEDIRIEVFDKNDVYLYSATLDAVGYDNKTNRIVLKWSRL
jgi:hypothetical protein